MGQVLALVLQSMQNDMKRVDRIGTNIANALTPGYKREISVELPFSEIVENSLQGNEMIGARIGSVSDYRPGTLKPTDHKFDFALTTEGFFEVKTQNGLAYTRQGNFQLDSKGRLVTQQGDPVMGHGGEIVLSINQPYVDTNGRFFEGQQKQEVPIAQFKIVQLDQMDEIQKDQNGMYVLTSTASPIEIKNPIVLQGQLENSNVSSIEEMIHLMQTMRHFESMYKVAQGYDDMIGVAVRKLGESS